LGQLEEGVGHRAQPSPTILEPASAPWHANGRELRHLSNAQLSFYRSSHARAKRPPWLLARALPAAMVARTAGVSPKSGAPPNSGTQYPLKS
jgi:hypothetical protein